jgi:D-amino-acid dehydrogenase
MSAVVVIGAGVVGACCALALLGDGHQVTLVEPDLPGGPQAASYGNGAWLSTASVVPMSLPGLWKNVPRYLLDPDGPLVIRPWALPRLTPWLLRFVAAGHRIERVEATARALHALLDQAPSHHAALAQAAGVADLVVQAGLTYAYPSRAAFEAEALAWRLRRDQGVRWRELDRDELQAHTPGLAQSYEFGIEVSAGGHCRDPGAYVAALVALAQARGAQRVSARADGLIIESGRLRAIRTTSGEVEADFAVISAGVDSGVLARAAGSRIPLESERGYHVVLPAPGLSMRTPLMPSDGKMAVTMTRAGLRISGQVELASRSADANWRRADVLLRHAQRMFPSLPVPSSSEATARWLGHRPSTPDGLPVLGPAGACAQVFCAFGHGHVGLAGAPASAGLIADLIAGRPSRIDPAPYRVGRFSEGSLPPMRRSS